MGMFSKSPAEQKLEDLTGGFLLSDEYKAILRANNIEYSVGEHIKNQLKEEIKLNIVSEEGLETRLRYLIKQNSKKNPSSTQTPEVETQKETVNAISDEVNAYPDLFTGFGTLHPDSDDIEGDFNHLLDLGLKGVKLHPDFQLFALNEQRAFDLGEVINEGDVPLLIHCGDFRYNYSNPEQLIPFLDKFPELTVIGAHFAGWSMWEDATRQLAGRENLYVDLSSSLYALSSQTAKELIHAYGPDKVLWGTDYPMWDSVSEMEYFDKIDLTDKERSMILYENAAKLLNLE